MVSHQELRGASWFVLVLAVAGCSTRYDDEVQDSESALSGPCSNTQRKHNADGLESLGFQQVGVRSYEYKWADINGYSYWREAPALRYEKGADVAYATCEGTPTSPMPMGAVTLHGEYFKYECTRLPCIEYDWGSPMAGTATVDVKDFGLKPLGGAAQLTVHVRAGAAPQVIDEDVILTKAGDVWSNAERMVSLTIQSASIVAASITTRPVKYNENDPEGTQLYNRRQFRADDGSASVAPLKTVAIFDGPAGIKVSPSALTFASDEAGKVRLINSSSYSVAYASSNTTPGQLKRSESVVLTVGVPAVLTLDPGFGGPVVVALKVAP